jgi:Amt family ammonium transporter
LILLWAGWFGFNAGSALAFNNIALRAMFNTFLASISGAAVWLFLEGIWRKPTFLGLATGILAGLVAVTPACGYVSPFFALIIGAGGGIASYFAITWLKKKLGYDDSLDVFGCHGASGLWGALATGLFSKSTLNPAGADGLLFGGTKLFFAEIVSIAVVVLFSVAMTYIILKLTQAFTPLRVSEENEEIGLDLSDHGEKAYELA